MFLPFRTQLDYSMLIYTTFYMGNPFGPKSSQRPELLSLYFTSTKMRSVFYLGCAFKLAWDIGIELERWSLERMIPIGMLALTSILNFKWNVLANNANCEWATVASEGKGFAGSWWIGTGNGNWFGFFGHNGNEELSIIPSSLLEQMSVKRSSTIILEEENTNST